MRIRCDVDPTAAIVCVPARDEADRIGRLLVSLAGQSVASAARPLRVLVASNNSTDATAAVVRAHEADPRLDIRLLEATFAPDLAHAGTARRFAMDAGADWIEAEGLADGVLISTDADAVAPEGWVAANIAALAQSEIVGGRLVIARDDGSSAPLSDLHAHVDRYWAAVRALEDRLDPPTHDPSPRHGDHTGASLALRAALYRGVGGVPPIPAGEDNALVAAVTRAGGRLRHCPDVWIEVSAREVGRAHGGMALEMVRRRETMASGTPYLLPSAAFWRAHLLRRATWRAEWSRLGPERGETHFNAIAYVAHREAEARPVASDDVPIAAAIAELEAMAGLGCDLPNPVMVA